MGLAYMLANKDGIRKTFQGKSAASTNGLALPQLAGASSSGMPSLPGQSPLGMSSSAPAGSSLTAATGQKKSSLY